MIFDIYDHRLVQENIKENVSRLYEISGIGPMELMRMTGLSYTAVMNLRRPNVITGLEVLIDVANAFHVHIDDLILRKDQND